MTPTFKYDPEADAAYIGFSSEPVQESDGVSVGIVLDFDCDGRIVGMEVMNARQNLPPEMLSAT
ncbi:DUF2283 domain-containing protein [Aquamicrobium zhengzhouense]|uniref:DUF2283 domain-containing protein n=1 Tax=Aquamicrobium zhengzhouense TaxID=2781738 RepID=A0ABS0SCE5_9HYPH|nr:DUF2283 domain-containing protein [Aquamicrobium zhengzhouense]MBI1620984.1 DUF2283 domain-containing protein [Aquamicrobium zhengzhouense]